MTTFKLIKSTSFDTNGVKGTVHTVAYKGRALNLSTLSFAETPEYQIQVDATAKTLVVSGGDIAIVQKDYLNELNQTVHGLSIYPKFDLAIDAF